MKKKNQIDATIRQFFFAKNREETVLFMIYNQLSEYLLKHLAQVQTLMMMSAGSEDAGFRSITRKLLFISQFATANSTPHSLFRSFKPKCWPKLRVTSVEHLICEM